MSEPRPVRTFPWGLPLWVWVVGALLLVLASLYGSLWLPELRERMAVRYLKGLPGCEIWAEPPSPYMGSPQLPFIPEYESLQWLHRLAPPHPRRHSIAISDDFPITEVRRVAAIRELESFNAAGTDFGDEHVQYVTRGSSFVLDGTRITDAGLAQLFVSAVVFELSIADTRVGNSGITAHAGQSRLDSVNFSGTVIGRAGLESLARSAADDLQTLNLSRTSVGDDEMAAIAKFTNLRAIDLCDTRVTDAGLVRLAAIPGWSVNGLFLDRTRIGDEGLRALMANNSPDDFSGLLLSGTRVTWEYIETWKTSPVVLNLAGIDVRDRAANWFVEHGGNCLELDLSDTRFTDIGVAALEQCASLRKLCVRNCAISEAAAIHFMLSSATAPASRSSWNPRPPPPPLPDRIRQYRETGWLER